jgi:hypothetical protein
MMKMELTTIYTEVIGNITYTECEITSDDKSLVGETRLALKATAEEALEGGTEVTTEEVTTTHVGDIEVSDSSGTIGVEREEVTTVSTGGILSAYKHRPLKDFSVIIVVIDTSSNGNEVEFDLNALTGSDDIKALIIRNPSEPKRVHVTMAMNTELDSAGNVTKLPALPSISILRFENCVFDKGISIMNRTKILVEFYGCEIYDSVNIFENRSPNPISMMNVVFENCNFHSLSTFLVGRLVNFKAVNIKFLNEEKPEGYYDTLAEQIEAKPELAGKYLSEYINPTFKIEGCEIVDISQLDYKNILSTVEVYDCRYVSMVSISGTHQVPSKPTSRPFVVHGCGEVTVAGVTVNGFRIDSCEKATVADIKIAYSMCGNAAVGVMLSRISKAAIVAGLVPAEGTVITGVDVSMCEGDVTISDPILQGNSVGINVNGCTGNVNVSGGIIKGCKNTGILVKSVSGEVRLLGTTIMECDTAVYAAEVGKFECVGALITGRNADGPIRDRRDIKLSSLGAARFVDKSSVSGVSMIIDTASDIEFQNALVERSYLDINTAGHLAIRKSLLSAEDIAPVEDKTPFMATLANKVSIEGSRFQGLTPDFKYVTTFFAKRAELLSGIKVHMSGDNQSEITECVIGNPDNLSDWAYGIVLNQCQGVDVKSNYFNAMSGKSVIVMIKCQYCIVDDYNEFSTDNLVISVEEGEMNNNHFIMKTKDAEGFRPKLTTTSVFKDLLYFFSIKEYRDRYGKTSEPDLPNTDEVFDQHLNVVSYVDREKPWVPVFLARVNKIIKSKLE